MAEFQQYFENNLYAHELDRDLDLVFFLYDLNAKRNRAERIQVGFQRLDKTTTKRCIDIQGGNTGNLGIPHQVIKLGPKNPNKNNLDAREVLIRYPSKGQVNAAFLDWEHQDGAISHFYIDSEALEWASIGGDGFYDIEGPVDNSVYEYMKRMLATFEPNELGDIEWSTK